MFPVHLVLCMVLRSRFHVVGCNLFVVYCGSATHASRSQILPDRAQGTKYVSIYPDFEWEYVCSWWTQAALFEITIADKHGPFLRRFMFHDSVHLSRQQPQYVLRLYARSRVFSQLLFTLSVIKGISFFFFSTFGAFLQDRTPQSGILWDWSNKRRISSSTFRAYVFMKLKKATTSASPISSVW